MYWELKCNKLKIHVILAGTCLRFVVGAQLLCLPLQCSELHQCGFTSSASDNPRTGNKS